MGLYSSVQTIAQSLNPLRSYWTCRLTTGKELDERGMIFDLRAGGLRPLDWSLDLVSTGDIRRIRELTLHCPDGKYDSLGIDEPGTCFQLKVASMHMLGAGGRQVECQLIGKVLNKENGSCTCRIWDRVYGLLHYDTTIYDFGSWRVGITPLGKLSLDVLGLRL